MEDLNKTSIYKMEINNGVGNMGLNEHHEKVSKVHVSDEDLVDILVDLGKKNRMINIDNNEGLNVPNAGDKFSKLLAPEIEQNKTAVLNDSSTSEKKFRGHMFLYRKWSLKKTFFALKQFSPEQKNSN